MTGLPEMKAIKAPGSVRDIAEIIMRFTPATLAFAAVMMTVSSVGISQRADHQINPLSLQWAEKGASLRAAGKLQQATDAYETALTVDPRNRNAFIRLGDIARQQGLQGKAVRYYRGALALEPADMKALGGTVNALVERGAIANARETVSRMKTLCRTDCGQIASLDRLIEEKVAQQTSTSATTTAEAEAENKTPAKQP